MRNIWVICCKELRSYFVSPIAYLLLAIFAVIFGWMFWVMLNGFVQYSMEAMSSGQSFPMNLNEEVIRGLLGNAGVIGLFFIPMITMRLFAEEKRTGTIELLATSPVQDYQIIFGKWFAAVLMYAIMLLFSGLSMIFLFVYGTPDWKPLAVGYLGVLLQGASLLAVGTFLSTLTKNQIVAAAAGFGLSLMLWIIGWASVSGGGFNSSTWAQVLSYFSMASHNESFSKGVLSIKDAVFFVSLTYLGLFLTARSMESLRWRS